MFSFIMLLLNILCIGFTYICLLAIQIISPLWIQIIIVFLNLFIQDPLPYFDEILQIIILIKFLKK